MAELVPLKNKIDTVAKLIDTYRADIIRTIPKHLTPDRLLQIAITCIRKNPALADCSPPTLIACIMEASALGLEIGGPLAQASLVPYKQACTLIIQYRGKIKLAIQSGEVDAVEARVVYAKDKFEYQLGLEPKVIHVPTDEPDTGPPIYFYSIAWLRGGRPAFEVMSKKQVDSHRARSRAKDDGPWVTDYEEMGKKTVAHKLCKYLVLSPENQRAVGLDDQADAGVPQDLRGIEIFTPNQPALTAGQDPPKEDKRPLQGVTERLTQNAQVQQGKVREPEPPADTPPPVQYPTASEAAIAAQREADDEAALAAEARAREQAEAAAEQQPTQQTVFSEPTSTARPQAGAMAPSDILRDLTKLSKEKGISMFDLSGYATKHYNHALPHCSTLELQGIVSKVREHPQGQKFQ